MIGVSSQQKTDRQDSLACVSSMSNVLDHEVHYGQEADDDLATLGIDMGTSQWLWVSAGACKIDPASGPPSSWFKETSNATSRLSLTGEPWRIDILQV